MTAPDWPTYRDVVELHLRFARALDENDWDAYRSCLADPVTTDYRDAGLQRITTSADDWTLLVREAVTPQTTVHYFTNFQVDLLDDGQTASTRLNHQSSHFVSNTNGASTYIQRGVYTTTARRGADAVWRLDEVTHRIAFATGNPGLAGPPSSELLDVQTRIYG